MALNDPPKVRGDGAISDRTINTILKDVFNRAADRLKGTAPVYVSTFDAQGRSLKRNRCTICAVALHTGTRHLRSLKIGVYLLLLTALIFACTRRHYGIAAHELPGFQRF